MDPHLLKNLLEKYKSGTCTAAEAKVIENWLNSINSAEESQLHDDFIAEQLQLNKAAIDGRITSAKLPWKRWNWMAVAASFLLITGLSVILWANYFRPDHQAALAANTAFIKNVANSWIIVQTPKGKTKNIKLTDGTLITLAASSRVRYPAKFTGHKRPVYLEEGEALFNVAKVKTSPFTVYTNKFATTALGTAFNIRSYTREHKVSISLIHGKIRIDDLHPDSKAAESKILLPHQQVVLNKQSGILVKSDFTDEVALISWKDGVLSFKNATMDEVINSIENRYAVTIVNKSKRNNWSYTGDFKGESLADVLKIVCLTEGLTCTITKNIITLN